MFLGLLLPPPPPPPLSKTPQPAVPSRAAPAIPAPPSLKNSLRLMPGARRTPRSVFSISSILIGSPFSARRARPGSPEHLLYGFQPLYGASMAPDVPHS